MALIASALYATQEDNHLNQKVAYREQLSKVSSTRDRNALILKMVNGSTFKVTVEVEKEA
jgi:hypothetical protein